MILDSIQAIIVISILVMLFIGKRKTSNKITLNYIHSAILGWSVVLIENIADIFDFLMK